MAKAKTPRIPTTRSKQNGGDTAVTPAMPATTSAPITTAVEVRAEVKETRKPAPEPRRNIVPINLEEEIRRRAYQLYEERGCMPGHENDDWLVAEREILSRYDGQRQQRA